MEKKDEDGTDAASIKPVSSLLSHFEGLKTHRNHARTDSPSRVGTEAYSTLEAPHPTFPVRTSLDYPRPTSPWNGNTGHVQSTPRTPISGPQQRTSPTGSPHKKAMSMHTLNPQDTPLVRIESPRSPPQTFFQRSSSRSPERIDNTTFAKVRELVVQNASRSSTRSNTPGLERDVAGTKTLGTALAEAASSTRTTSPARQPPPVNRADKPKVPAKPSGIVQAVPGSLTPGAQLRRPSMEARISPFSTPPSSAESSPPPIQPIGISPFSPADTASASENETPDTPDDPNGAKQPSEPGVQQGSVDPRLMGFSSVKMSNERKDPRLLGFSNSTSRSASTRESPTPLTRTNFVTEQSYIKNPRSFGFSHASANSSTSDRLPPKPVRANTLVEQQPPKDAREFGFGSMNPSQTLPAEPIRQIPPLRTLPPPAVHNPRPAAVPSRDARQFGFSGDASPVTVTDLSRPSLPTRRTVQEAPPRPSEMSKPNAKPSLPNVTKNVTEGFPRFEPSPARASQPMSTSDSRFPPPPKRNTFSEEDNVAYQPSIPHLQRASTVASVHTAPYSGDDLDSSETGKTSSAARNDYPDATQANRRPPFNLLGQYEINVRGDPRVFDVCGKYLCVSGYTTRVFDMETGDQVMAVGHGETVKVTAVKFRPGASFEDEGLRLWLGNNIGDMQELDIATQTITAQSLAHNRREVIRMLRHRRNLLSLDDEGKLLVWQADRSGIPDLKSPPIVHKTQRGHTFSMVIHDHLWLATGKEIHIYRPGNEAQFNVQGQALSQSSTGDVTSGAYTSSKGGKVYFGHTDGKVSIYSTSDFTLLGTVKVSDYKINSLAFVRDQLWAAYKTGKVYVYDTSTTPWKVKKDWPAHNGPVHRLVLDPSSVWTLQRLHVVTAGHDNCVRMWDATLEEDWIENAMQERDVEYCSFRELKTAVVTWNVGAIVPSALRSDFIADAIRAEDPPDIVVVGLQEVVDLEDRTMTAKSLLGFGKKKEAAKSDQQQQHQSRVYREWRDYVARCLDRYVGSRYSYAEVHMSSLVGLFQCIFIRQEERKNVSMVSATNVKCGMGGHYGNKGALVTRFVLDDSSLCFTNCHLAAGQTQTSNRNNDIATILESESLGVEPNRKNRSSLFVGGGDGTQILDHEICILNGDLNYRIDTIPRDTVIKMIRNNELAKLLDRDQLLVSRRRVSGFRLSAFTELPITFAPTYKYDPGTDNYDSSEKKRSPAWCDRMLYRGPGKVKQIEYRRHEVKVSDHRPVSGMFKIRVKKINAAKREKALDECYQLFKTAKKELAEDVCVRWLVDVMGLAEKEARILISG